MKITIIGGGTAGWLTALYFNRVGYDDVTVIDSSRVGILGAGEASTPNFPGLLMTLGISEREFLKTTGATMKVANDFVNWSPTESEYSHGFGSPEMPLIKVKMIHGYHFDARKCAEYFKNIGVERKIKHLDVNVTNFTQNENGDITQIHTEENIDVETDFVFDCTGFARLCIGKLYKSSWKSYSKYLKANSAIAFFLPQEPNLTSLDRTHTRSISMKNGWMWQAPLQHRRGCGYVFNDTYTTAEDVKKEAEEYIGRELEVIKTFKFEAGAYEKTWINNCVALGLASGFLEPLEGTSLMGVITSIQKIARLGIENTENRDIYNEFVNDMNHQSMLFVRHHYNCGRTDTKFWKDIKEEELPKDLENILKDLYKFKETSDLLDAINLSSKFPIFGLYNYVVVDLGHKTKQQKTLL